MRPALWSMETTTWGAYFTGTKQTRKTKQTRMKINRFEDLQCWQESRKLVTMVYEAIRSSRSCENDYRLKDQSIGAASSVMGNPVK